MILCDTVLFIKKKKIMDSECTILNPNWKLTQLVKLPQSLKHISYNIFY